jgi:hypothetical protein
MALWQKLLATTTLSGPPPVNTNPPTVYIVS